MEVLHVARGDWRREKARGDVHYASLSDLNNLKEMSKRVAAEVFCKITKKLEDTMEHVLSGASASSPQLLAER